MAILTRALIPGSPYRLRQERGRCRKGRINGGRAAVRKGFPRTVRLSEQVGIRRIRPSVRFRPAESSSIQEFAMADVAFVLITIAVFALVAVVARGVAKL
ncbi:hypothetical protein GCM10010232_17830 [Streptomyces amakusaensis]